MTRIITALFTALLFVSNVAAQDVDKHEMFRKMMTTIDGIKTVSFKLDKTERIKGKMMPGSQDVKLNVTPHQCYLKIHVPNKGAEVLYREGENKDNCKVNPNAFPYMTLNLDPDGSILRKDQHHSVKQLGFKYTGDLLNHVYTKYKSKINEFVTINGEVTYDGRKCLNITLTNKEYKIESYTVLAGENLLKIARKLRLDEYALLELNGKKNFDDVKAGQTIKVPNSLCKKIEMYIDKENYLPLYQKLYDEKGLMATYEYTKLVINPTFKPGELTTEYSEYDF
ncbi:MAG: outer membrane lipoprotein-sorting protein [Bacteroidia bacterium]|jgi:outer membrane lipoprotein-sorting protein